MSYKVKTAKHDFSRPCACCGYPILAGSLWEQRGMGYRVHHSCPPQGEEDERCEECGGGLVPTLMGIFCENSQAYRDMTSS